MWRSLGSLIMKENDSIFGDAIYAYTRKQAIEDGVLVDLSQFEEFGQMWNHHVACTDTVWNIIEAASKEDGKDLKGILWDVSNMSRYAARRAQGQTQVLFRVIIGNRTHQLKFHIGGGDQGEPVLTLMLPNES